METTSFNYPELIEILQQNSPCVMATVIQTHGSTPQKAGSSALIGTNQLVAGTIGGGMTELKVIQQSQALIKSKISTLFSFNLGGDLNKGSESICGGSMTILVDATPELHLPVFKQLRNSLDERKSGVLITLVDESNPECIRINRYWVSKTDQFSTDIIGFFEPILSEMLQNPMIDPCRLIPVKGLKDCNQGFVFLESITPKPTLIIAGAGHIGQSLAHLGKFLGFEVTIWDDRPEYADKTRIPDADFVWSGPIDSAINSLKIHDDSYLVIVTHGHKSDGEVLRKFISKPSAYIGMIGSKAKISQMKAVFLENAWANPDQWEHIFTPVGLDIGALTIQEIAVSIAAQLVQVRNKRKETHE